MDEFIFLYNYAVKMCKYLTNTFKNDNIFKQ